MKNIVTISRYWKHPTIKTSISNESISLAMSLDDFMEALKTEIGSVATTFTQKTFSEKCDKAVQKVLSKVKEESVKKG